MQLGIEQCAKHIFGTAVRIAVPEKINGLKAQFATPQYASVYGLICAHRTAGHTTVAEREIRAVRKETGYRKGRGYAFFHGIAEFFRSFL